MFLHFPLQCRKHYDHRFWSHSIHKLETRQKKPNAELLVKLSRLFGVSVDALVKDEQEV
jgi:hypothetical protein